MELNGDGHLDILSGSYSRQSEDMAGLFQVLWGDADGTWCRPEALTGSDGQPLILPKTNEVTDRICTRPFAVDYDGDGKLDIVAGNFSGTFGLFKGLGKGDFEPVATWLEDEHGDKLKVDMHGDPFFVDWDGDGDLDLLSGSAAGGVFLFTNVGERTNPKWGARTTLVASAGHGRPGADVAFGDAHLKAPAADTRVWADDVDGDGRLDLLVGDQIVLMHLADGVAAEDARTKLAAWQKKQQAFFEQPQEDSEEGRKKWQDAYQALEQERDTFAKQEYTGFVWLIRQKAPAAAVTGAPADAAGSGQSR